MHMQYIANITLSTRSKFSTFFIFLFLSTIIGTNELSETYDEQVQEMAKEGYNLIDSFFQQAHTSIVDKQDIMTLEWFTINNENKEKLENILSDAYLIFKCDQNRENPIPKLLSAYVETKLYEEIPKVFDIYGVSTKRVDDFYQFSCVLCELSQGINCDTMKRKAKREHFARMLQLKMQKKARKQLRKEQAYGLRQLLMMGSQREGKKGI